MKILIPVAAYHEYNTAIYVERALRDLGHEARVITQAEFYEDHPDVDLFFGVDSAGPLDFPEKHLSKTSMWFIDSRHNNDPHRRRPDDDMNAAHIANGGGWVFQAQKRDWMRNDRIGIHRSCWLPLAADADVWHPEDVVKEYDVAFGGNVWDGVRGQILEDIRKEFRLLHLTGNPEVLSLGYSKASVGFNISSFWGTDVCYDVNMRVFEVMACGVPLVTNYLPEFQELGLIDGHNVLAYRDLAGAMARIREALGWDEDRRQEMGRRARALILAGHTYRDRMEEVLEILSEAGVVTTSDKVAIK